MDDNIEITASGLVKKKKPIKRKRHVKPKTDKATDILDKLVSKITIQPKKERKKKINQKTLSAPLIDKGQRRINARELAKPLVDEGKKRGLRETLDFFNKELEKFIDLSTKKNGKSIKLISKDIFSDAYDKAIVQTNINGYPIDKIPLVNALFDEYEDKPITKRNREEVTKTTNEKFLSYLDEWINKLIKEYDNIELDEFVFNKAYDNTILDLVTNDFNTSLVPKKESIKNRIIIDYNNIYKDKIKIEKDKIKKLVDDKINEYISGIKKYYRFDGDAPRIIQDLIQEIQMDRSNLDNLEIFYSLPILDRKDGTQIILPYLTLNNIEAELDGDEYGIGSYNAILGKEFEKNLYKISDEIAFAIEENEIDVFANEFADEITTMIS